jgi:hypothetical protein
MKISLVWTVCPVTKELYGYAQPVLDEATTMRAFRAAYEAKTGYCPDLGEQDVARRLLQERAERKLQA